MFSRRWELTSVEHASYTFMGLQITWGLARNLGNNSVELGKNLRFSISKKLPADADHLLSSKGGGSLRLQREYSEKTKQNSGLTIYTCRNTGGERLDIETGSRRQRDETVKQGEKNWT